VLYVTSEVQQYIAHLEELLEHGAVNEAEIACVGLVRRFPREMRFKEAYFRTLHKQAKYQAALIQANSLLSSNPRSGRYLHWRAMCMVSLGNLEHASEDLQKAYEINPKDHAVALDFAKMLSALSRRHRAISVLNDLLAVKPEAKVKMPAIFELLNLYVRSSLYREAATLFKGNVKLCRAHLPSLVNGFRAQAALSNVDAALAILKEICSKREWRGEGMFQEAIYRLELGQPKRAGQLFDLLTETWPENLSYMSHAQMHFPSLERHDRVAKTWGDPLGRLTPKGDALKAGEKSALAFCHGYAAKAKGDSDRFYEFIKVGHAELVNDSGKNAKKASELVLHRLQDGDATFTSKLESAAVAKVPTKRGFFFIVGVPRSGSTLLQQVLLTSPDQKVIDIGESGIISDLYQTGIECGFAEPNAKAGNFIEQSIESRLDIQEAQFIIDKSLQNIAFARTLLEWAPNSRIIICQRDAVQVIFSILSNNLVDQGWAHDPSTIIAYIDAVKRQTDVALKYGERVYLHEHDAFVSDPTGMVDQLAVFTGLNVSSKSIDRLDSLANRVSTASQGQVRGGIQSKHHELPARFIDDLTPFADKYQWLKDALVVYR